MTKLKMGPLTLDPKFPEQFGRIKAELDRMERTPGAAVGIHPRDRVRLAAWLADALTHG